MSEDLATIKAEYRGLVGCPLCLRLFAEEAIDLEPPQLTEEHIIPGELGGKIITLTCKDCNNTHGSEIDAHLIQMLRSRDSIEGLSDRPFRGRIEIGGMSVPTNIDWKASVGKMTTFALRRFKPTVHEAIRSQMRAGSVKAINVILSFDFIPGRADLALLRIAYLTMFREFGYRYILSPAASVIRDIVSSYEKCPTEIGKFVGQVGGEPERFGTPLQLLKIQGGVAIMVVMALLTETRRYYAAFMPRDVDADGKVEHQWFDHFYFVMGYPASRNQSDTNHRRKKIHVKSFHLATNPPPGDPFQKEKLSRAEHLLVEFDHNETVVERKKVVPPKLQGVSGGGIFCISRSSNTGPLVAIATEHRKRSSILVGTRVRYFVQVARELARTEPLEIFE